MTVIISDYTGHYEKIYTVECKSMFLLKLKYQFFKRGYRVWAFPTLWMAKLAYKYFNKSIYQGTNVSFEKYIPGTDQITYWMPWMNFH